LAWLHAAPEKPNKKGPGVPRLTTLTTKAKLGGEAPGLEMPPVDAGNHLLKHLFDVGPSSGGEVLTYTEIANWIALTGNVLTAWEAETLRKLSVAYLNERDLAKDPERPAPYLPQT
jgi:hypothetical protein